MYSTTDISYYIISLGCSKNQTDSERLHGSLRNAGFLFSESLEDSDIIIINTCGFIEDAKKESIEVILDAAELCHEGTSDILGRKRLVVTGCLSQRYFDQLQSDMPEIDLLYGITDDKLSHAICSLLGIEIAVPGFERDLLVGTPFEYIKIAEGCSNNCSYCAIPLIRGAHHSVPIDDVLQDARRALSRGARELVIIAQDIAAYSCGPDDLYSLVDKISRLDGDFWIRLMYCHPDKIDSRIMGIFTDIPKVAPYIDMPLQHVDGAILTSMNRRGNYETYKGTIEELRKRIPDIAVRTTFMVGYPGETEESFQALLKFVHEVPFDRGGVFRFSPEENTAAAELPGGVDEEVSIRRFNQLSEALENQFRKSLKKRIGKRVPVLVEQMTEEGQWLGRSIYDAPEVDGVFYLTGDGELLNKIVEAEVIDTFEFDLVGEK